MLHTLGIMVNSYENIKKGEQNIYLSLELSKHEGSGTTCRLDRSIDIVASNHVECANDAWIVNVLLVG